MKAGLGGHPFNARKKIWSYILNTTIEILYGEIIVKPIENIDSFTGGLVCEIRVTTRATARAMEPLYFFQPLKVCQPRDVQTLREMI